MKHIAALLVLLFASASLAAAPTVNVSLNPAIGVAPYTSTLTWTVSGASSCAASDGWTGAKAVTGGTLQVTVSAATKYTLTCVAADGQTTTTWTPPTTNTDNSALTDLAGFNVYRGTSSTNLARVKSLGPAITNYTDTALASGSYWYAVTAVSASSTESARSAANPSPVVVKGSSASASAQASIQTTPSAPTGVITVSVSTSTETTVSVGTP